MKTLSCKDMGMDDDYVAKGATEDEVMMKMKEHHKNVHGGEMMGMTEEEMNEKMKMSVKDEM